MHSWNHLAADTQAEYLQSQLWILHFHLISISLLKLSVWPPDVHSSLVFNGLIFKPFMLLLVNGEETQGVTKLWLVHQLPFSCYDKTLQPWKPTDRSFFGLMFSEGELISVGKQGSKGRHRNRNKKLRACRLYCELEVGWGCQLSMPGPSDVSPPARLKAQLQTALQLRLITAGISPLLPAPCLPTSQTLTLLMTCK